MIYTVQDAVSELEGILHGTTTNKITGLYGVFNRAARQFILDVDAQETTRIQQTEAIFSRVYEYEPAVDLKGNRIIDIRPQADRSLSDNPNNTYSRNFSLGKGRILNPQIAVEYNSATKKLLINNPRLPQPVQFANTGTIVGNGTWSVSGDASNLTENNTDYVDGVASLQFDLATSGTQGVIVNSTLAQTDLSDHLNQSSLFLSVELPTASAFTSFELRWGNDASNYWSKTETAQFGGASLINGWNLLGFDWSSATQVGSPDAGVVDYVELLVNYNGTAQTAFKVSGITSNLGTVYDVQYYSKYLFRDSNDVWVEKLPNEDTALAYRINLETESINLFLYKLAEFCVQQALGQDAMYDTNFFQNKYTEELNRYKALYPSQAIKLRERYYRQPNQNYRRNWGVPYTR
jgi:hypothetical protein